MCRTSHALSESDFEACRQRPPLLYIVNRSAHNVKHLQPYREIQLFTTYMVCCNKRTEDLREGGFEGKGLYKAISLKHESLLDVYLKQELCWKIMQAIKTCIRGKVSYM